MRNIKGQIAESQAVVANGIELAMNIMHKLAGVNLGKETMGDAREVIATEINNELINRGSHANK